MSSIRLLHRSSLSLLPLQCCNCNNLLAHILLLISSLFSALCVTNNSVSKKNNNNESCLYHRHQQHQQQQKKISICNNNIPYISSCSCPLRLKKSIPDHPYGCVGLFTQFASGSVLSTRSGIQAAKCIDSHTSDTYILTQLTTTADIDFRDNSSSSSISWKRSERNCALTTTRGRRLQKRSQQQQNQSLYRASDYCWYENSKNNKYRRSSNNSSSGNSQNITSDCHNPQKTLLFKSSTKTYSRQHSIITSTFVEKAEVAAAVIAPTFVDLTHPSLHLTFTPHNNCEDSSFTSKYLINNNNNKPFSTPSAQRLFSSSSTPLLLQEKRQNTHSNTDSGVSTLLHVLVQLRKSTLQPKKPQHILVRVKSYA